MKKGQLEKAVKMPKYVSEKRLQRLNKVIKVFRYKNKDNAFQVDLPHLKFVFLTKPLTKPFVTLPPAAILPPSTPFTI